MVCVRGETDIKFIELTQGRRAMIDDDDFERVSQYKWHWNKGHYRNFETNKDSSGYARRNVSKGKNENGKRRMETVWLHRFIMNAPPGLVVDHLRDTLDNRKEHLRVVTQQQNMTNRRDNVA